MSADAVEGVLERHGVEEDDAVALLKSLVGTPSATGNEEAMARLLLSHGRDGGLTGRLQEIAPGRFNAILEARGEQSGPSLLFNGHLDTSYSGAEPHILPGLGFRPQASMRDGWLMGLGAFNMKSGLAAALVATMAARTSGALARGTVTVAGVSGEIEKACVDEFQSPECMGYGFGTRQLMAHGTTADLGVVCEPTGFRLGYGQLGAVWVKLTVHGASHHTVYVRPGMDHAVYKAVAITEALHRWGDEYAQRNTYDGQPAAVSVGAIRGGWPWRISRTPADCHLYVDARITPAQTPKSVLQEIQAVAESVVGPGGCEVHPYVIVPALEDAPVGPIYEAVTEAHRAVHGEDPGLVFRAPMGDAVHMVHAGIPTLTYGLGPMGTHDRIHPDTGEAGEHVRVEDYMRLISVYLGVIERLCGPSGGS